MHIEAKQIARYQRNIAYMAADIGKCFLIGILYIIPAQHTVFFVFVVVFIRTWKIQLLKPIRIQMQRLWTR